MKLKIDNILITIIVIVILLQISVTYFFTNITQNAKKLLMNMEMVKLKRYI